jgi:hypothetical protein
MPSFRSTDPQRPARLWRGISKQLESADSGAPDLTLKTSMPLTEPSKVKQGITATRHGVRPAETMDFRKGMVGALVWLRTLRVAASSHYT